MKLSVFGKRFSSGAGILSLMDDLGNALARGGTIMMGGGNPAHVPEVQEVLRRSLRRIVEDPARFRQLIGVYDPPPGNGEFLDALAGLLRREYGWQLGPENICLTNGSQGSFFLLFNMLAGEFEDGTCRKILLPLTPEYIGYADLGLCEDLFATCRPRIELVGDHFFKYHVDFDRLEVGDDIAALCVSRPTNPTGNVLTDDEIDRLAGLAAERDIPLIIDNAYGVPFPGIIFTQATPVWNEHLIVCMSLSKFGLPAVRTGIVIARPEVIRILAGINAILNLAPGSFGAMLTTDLIRSGEILRLSREVIRPFYHRRMERALAGIEKYFRGLPCRVHVPEGAMFLWLWFQGLPVSSRELYDRLKARGVLVVSGEYFFPGLAPGWPHMRECIRITYSQDEDDVRQGLQIVADEVRRIYSEQQ
ncbi:MAG TPA: valine--pyruvate transaminase [Desulfobulbus sp.]|nr:valine--pyruvate transaminase [Desulfobulbus sp.]